MDVCTQGTCSCTVILCSHGKNTISQAAGVNMDVVTVTYYGNTATQMPYRHVCNDTHYMVYGRAHPGTHMLVNTPMDPTLTSLVKVSKMKMREMRKEKIS